MGQLRYRRSSFAVAALAAVECLALLQPLGCRRNSTSSTPPPAPHLATVASLVPAATDLIVGMNARDRLVAVSTFDAHRPDVAALPRVGDYQTTDWETLAALDPTCMVIQIDPAHVPPGMLQRAAAQHTDLVNVHIDRLGDIPATLAQLGRALQLPAQAAHAAADLQHRLDAVRQAVQAEPSVPALLVVGDGADSVAGASTFLDDLLSVAGGSNVAAPLGKPWPQLDRETLLSLRPAVVIVLMPDAAPQRRAAAIATWRSLRREQPAERVFLIDSSYALLPGIHVADLAAQFAACLHAAPLPAGVAAPAAVD